MKESEGIAGSLLGRPGVIRQLPEVRGGVEV